MITVKKFMNNNHFKNEITEKSKRLFLDLQNKDLFSQGLKLSNEICIFIDYLELQVRRENGHSKSEIVKKIKNIIANNINEAILNDTEQSKKFLKDHLMAFYWTIDDSCCEYIKTTNEEDLNNLNEKIKSLKNISESLQKIIYNKDDFFNSATRTYNEIQQELEIREQELKELKELNGK